MNLRYNNLDNFNHYPENSQLLMVNHSQDGWTIQPKIEKEYIYIYVRILKYFLLTSSKVTKHPHFFGSAEKTHKQINKNYSIDLKTHKKKSLISKKKPKAAIHIFFWTLTCALMQLLRDGRLGDSWHSPLKPPSFSKPKVMSGEKWKNEQKNVCWGNSTKHQNSCQSFLGLN